MSARVICFATRKVEGTQRLPVPQERAGKAVRKALLAKIHVAKKQLGMTDDEYRALLLGNFGQESAARLSVTELEDAVHLLRAAGFKLVKVRSGREDAPKALLRADKTGRQPLLKKIEAQLAEKGRVEGCHIPFAYALAILKRQTGGRVARFEDACDDDLYGVITALTVDAVRKGRYAGAWGTKQHDLSVVELS